MIIAEASAAITKKLWIVSVSGIIFPKSDELQKSFGRVDWENSCKFCRTMSKSPIWFLKKDIIYKNFTTLLAKLQINYQVCHTSVITYLRNMYALHLHLILNPRDISKQA
jgi:hypothetical protein